MMPYKDPEKARENHRRYMKEVWYPRNKKKHLGFVRKARTSRRKEIAEWISNLKSLTGCIDCNNNDYRVLDFDHLGEKIFTISQGHDKTKEEVVNEIAKCEVRCANCHRIKTWERKHNIAGMTNGRSEGS